MKALEIVSQLSQLLPQLTDKFTDNITITSMTRILTAIAVQTSAPHGLSVGQAVAIYGTDTPIPITSLTRSGTVGTLVTTADHDLTNGIAESIRITGATQAEFNGTFTRINIDNRRTIKFEMANSGATIATGSPELRDANSRFNSYNRTFEVSSVSSTTIFAFLFGNASMPAPKGFSSIRARPRISSCIDIDRAKSAYTDQNIDVYWAFVTLGDVVASQSRLIGSDAVDNQQRNVNYRQQIIEPFTVYVFMPVETEIAARVSRDAASDLLRPILRSLLFSKLSTGLFADKLNSVQFVGHNIDYYDTSLYVHAYTFQQVAEIYEEDTVGHDIDVAMRDIDFKIFTDFGTQVDFLQGTPDLDDVPL